MTRPHTLIIYAHPSPGSFNHAVLQAVTDSLDRKSRPYDVIDLYADGFDPRYTPEELALFHEGGMLDTLVTSRGVYSQKISKHHDSWIFRSRDRLYREDFAYQHERGAS